jgi:outer membrane immunogenic protein
MIALRIAAAAAALALLTGPAAANGSNKWTGFYVGAHAGYGAGHATTRDDPADWGNDPKFIGPFRFSTDGVLGGGTLGYNYQAGALVVGLEADLGYMGVSGSRNTESSQSGNHQTLEIEGGFYAVLGGRVGLSFGGTLLYGKGGWAYWDTDVTQTTTAQGYKTNGSGALDGYAFGGGIEHAVAGGWSIKAEYLRLQFDDARGDQTSITDPPIGHVYENETKLAPIDTFRVGVNYKFN